MNAPHEESGVGAKGAVRMRRPERKRQILHHAKQLFVSLGYQHTTTERIARAAGVTEPVLYRHFPSKKALFLDVLDEVRATTIERWRQETSTLPSAMARLRAVVDLYMGGARAHVLELRVMHRTLLEAEDPDIAEKLRAFYVDTESLLAEVIGAGQASGDFRSDVDPRVAAWEFIRNAMGFGLTAALDLPIYKEPGYTEAAMQCMFRCLTSGE